MTQKVTDYYSAKEIIDGLRKRLDDAIYKGELHRAKQLKVEIKSLSKSYGIDFDEDEIPE